MNAFLKKILPHLCVLLFIGAYFAITTDVFAQVNIRPPASASNPQQTSGWLTTLFSGVSAAFVQGVQWILLGIVAFFAWILGFAATLFEYVVIKLVVGMGDEVLKRGWGVSIDLLWKVIRDLVNICFIFALIYIGINTIIHNESSSAKKLLASVIISALLVNFSLFFAKVVIDFSNVTADHIYRLMVTTPNMQTASIGISGTFMDQLGVAPLWSGTNGTAQNPTLQTALKEGGLAFSIVYALGASLLIFKLAFVFLMGAMILVIRFAVLILLMIFAPVAFLPSMLPGVGEYRSKWWSTLMSQAFVAPVYLFGLYLSLLIITAANPITQPGGNGLLGLFASADLFMATLPLLMFYVIAIVMLLGVTTMAKSMSEAGASWASSGVDWAEGKIKSTLSLPRQGLERGARATASFAGRNTIGVASRKLGKLNDKLEGTKRGRIAKGLFTAATLGAVDEKTRRELTQAGQEATFGGSWSLESKEAFDKERRGTQNEQKRHHDQEHAIHEYEETLKTLTEEMKKGPPTQDAITHFKDALDEARKNVRDMTNGELEHMELDELKKISGLLSNKQMDFIKDHKDNWNAGEKQAIKDARKADQLERFTQNPDVFLGKMKAEEIASLDVDKILLQPQTLKYISGEVLRKLQDNDAFGSDLAKANKLASTIVAAGVQVAGRTPPYTTEDVAMQAARKYLESARGASYYGSTTTP